MRVVSLACSNTEIVCALGLSDLLIGVDSHSDRPPNVVSRLPKVGPDLDIDISAVRRLEPDLVLASLTVPGHERVVAGLAAAELPYVALEPVSLEDVYRDVLTIARALGVPERGDALVREMRAALRPVSVPYPPRLLVQWWPKPVIAPGRLSWVDDVIRAAGGRNLLEEAVKSRPLSDEEIAELNPDAIILAWCGVAPEKYRPDVVYKNPQWERVRAVQGKQVHRVPEAFLGRPGPGLVQGFHALQKIVEDIRKAGLDER